MDFKSMKFNRDYYIWINRFKFMIILWQMFKNKEFLRVLISMDMLFWKIINKFKKKLLMEEWGKNYENI
jgi:hypothetical protein